MFTGLIEELGRVQSLTKQDRAAQITVFAPQTAGCVHPGDSVAIDGVCLTVTTAESGQFTADIMPQTLTVSTLGGLSAGAVINVERAVTPTTHLGGHLVQGHVDAVGLLLARRAGSQCEVLRFSLPPELATYVVPQGSIAVDGVSLTVVSVGVRWFEVSLIPTTLSCSGLGTKAPGSKVNLEADVFSKYLYRHLKYYLDHNPLLPSSIPRSV
ncbi:riboflavin synthase [Streptomyces sp. 1222.5]|uniref:riboflavin synthase n=1 Tax=Streptomyces sp. 1222.5 TaxID=1881026 RepID=UPI003EBF039C